MGIKEMTGERARQHLDDGTAVFVDIRDPGSYASGHIEGAILLADQETAEAFTSGTNKSDTIVVYCYHGNSSRGAAHYLAEQGFENAYSMAGGFEEWRHLHPFVAAS